MARLKSADIARQRYAPGGQHRRIEMAGHPQLTVVFEGDQPALEQLVEMRREQQAIAAVEPFPIIGFTPRLDVARTQVSPVQEPGQPAGLLVALDVVAIHALAAARGQQALAGAGIQALPRAQCVLGHIVGPLCATQGWRHEQQFLHLAAEAPAQERGDALVDAREVDG